MLRTCSLRMELPYPEPAHSAFYYKVFGEDVHFDCVRGRILFHRDLLDTPLPSSNPALRNLYEAECARLLADLEEGGFGGRADAATAAQIGGPVSANAANRQYAQPQPAHLPPTPG